ncbi:MAG TPA: penicillin-binding transpeptidase domain-containing protein, partial [Acidimicrobiia bacterium]|nr:penicillin-binding transpeptidase domain-containing protein [Acidimicrobiia bacterium]
LIGALLAGACSGGQTIRPDSTASTTTAAGATSTSTTAGSTTPTTSGSAGTTTTTEQGITEEDLEDAAGVVDALLAAWASFDWPSALVFLSGATGDTEPALESWRSSLDVLEASFEARDPAIVEDSIVVSFDVTLDLDAFGEWSYTSTAVLARGVGGWRVLWAPSLLHPDLEEGHRFLRVAEWSGRASILARDGTPIAEQTSTKLVGVIPERIEDREQLIAELEALAGIDPAIVERELDNPGNQPDWFLPVGELTSEQLTEVGDTLIAIPGVAFRDSPARAGAIAGFAPLIVGRVGEITAELLDRLGTPYGVGDIVGRSGMELAFERTLAGTPAQEIRHLNEFSRTLEVAGSTEGTEPEDLVTSLDVAMQLAAQEAIQAAEEPAAMVVIDVDTGEIRAAASKPTSEFDRSLGGLYPPGSTFKIVTLTALLQTGMSPDDIVGCPGEVVINGRRFRNSDSRDLGNITLAEAFAESCNTTFAQLAADRLTNEDLDAVAAGFGFDAGYDLPVFDNGGQFPLPPDQAGRAAAAIGQGQVLASPLHMATVAAAVAGGGWLEPTIVAFDEGRTRLPLGDQIVADLKTLMLLVVTEGTAGKAKVDGEVVSGKTGTAEFGSGEDLDTHAWFVGFWEGLAFAVVVEGGGSGGQTAAPIAADFIERMAG